MKIRDVSIKNRLNFGFGICLAVIVLLGLVGFQGTMNADSKASQAISAAEKAGAPGDVTATARLKEILDINSGIRMYFLMLGIGSLAFGIAASLVIRGSIASPIRTVTGITSRLAEGDLTMDSHLGVQTKDEFNDIKNALLKLLTTWRVLVKDMKSAAGDISSAARELAASAGEMSMGSGEQASRSSQVAAASEQMSQTILDIAKSVGDIAESASKTVVVAKNGDEIVIKSVEKVKEIAQVVNASAAFVKSLGERSKQIGEIVNVINDIADQTNLLALNAAIEAARAGEHGRGFAVVADEVRKLSERTALSTSEIGKMTRAIQQEVLEAVRSMDYATSNVGLGVELVVQAGSALQEIVGSADGLQLMVHQIASATDEMSATSESISKDIEQIASVSKDASSSAAQVARASELLANLSNNIEKASGRFRLE